MPPVDIGADVDDNFGKMDAIDDVLLVPLLSADAFALLTKGNIFFVSPTSVYILVSCRFDVAECSFLSSSLECDSVRGCARRLLCGFDAFVAFLYMFDDRTESELDCADVDLVWPTGFSDDDKALLEFEMFTTALLL